MRRALFQATILIALAGCGPLPADEQPLLPGAAKADAPPRPALTLATYNVGLARGAVALAEERLPHIIAALRGEPADAICLQEVWSDEDAQQIVRALQPTHPYSFRSATSDDSQQRVKCNAWQTFMLDRCVKQSCTPQGISAEQCVQTACAARYQALSDECKQCLAANTASPIWCALWPGARDYAWGGRNGLLLLARQPLARASYTAFESRLVKRGMISARIAGIDVRCTHLSSNLETVPYPAGGPLASWQQELAAQVAAIDASSPRDSCSVLLGDLNSGPQTATLTGELPEIYALLAAAGFTERWPERRCTWCKDNPLAGSASDRQLDHIMLRGCTLTARYSRAHDAPLAVVAERRTLQTRLSDHYGLRAALGFPELY